MDPLTEIANKYGTDKGTAHKPPYGQSLQYTPVYHDLFQHLRNTQFHLLEIGVAEGRSIEMWREYFPFATIHGWDWSLDQCQHLLARSDIHLQVVNEQEPQQLLNAWFRAGQPQFEIVIDDAMHLLSAHLISMYTLLPRALSPTGFWVIEDLSDGKPDPVTPYLPRYPYLQCEVLPKWPDWRGYMQIVRHAPVEF